MNGYDTEHDTARRMSSKSRSPSDPRTTSTVAAISSYASSALEGTLTMALDYVAPETIQIHAMLDETRELLSNGMRRGLSNGMQCRLVRPLAADAAPRGRWSR
jgi:hypothetical protein